MTLQVAIADYGVGNLKSVANAVQVAGGEPVLVADPERLRTFERLILPGVGAFRDAIASLHASGLGAALTEQVQAGKSVLGICLGMQLMCRDSSEDGMYAGLGWFDAVVRRFPEHTGLQVPHVGWNDLRFTRTHPIVHGLQSGCDVYFVHSYRVECTQEADVLAWCDYGGAFAAMIARENLCGIQFHPEKSQRVGLAMLKNFIEQGCSC